MHIKLLGTASAEGWPGLFCRCDVCQRSRVVRGKNLRSRSTTLIDGALKIDLPPDTLHHILNHNLDLGAIRHLLFTHSHDDHAAVSELQYMSWMFVPNPDHTPFHILAPQDVARRIGQDPNLRGLPLEVECAAPWEPVQIGRWLVTPVPADHTPERPCFNYIIRSDEKTLLYATDTGWYQEPTWRQLEKRRFDGVVVECTKGIDEGGYNGHLSIPQVIRMRERLLASGALAEDTPVVTTHHSHLGGLLHEEREALLNPHGIQVGYDGMELEI